ncbi:MAG TPA: hypothetical protein VFE46_01670 [Pirellulales bacterium]|jgi:hypothetical protein|nr:hypothetical protein [Pirellulales bacterium]
MTGPDVEQKNSIQQPASETAQSSLTAQQQTDLNDPQTQARYWEEFNAQMRKLYCPGCGEG